VTDEDLEVIQLGPDEAGDTRVEVTAADRRWSVALPAIAIVASLTALTAIAIDDLSTHRRLNRADRALAASQRDAQQAAAGEQTASAERDRVTEDARRDARLREDAKNTATSGSQARGTREIVADKRAARWCRARDIRVLDSGLDFLRFQNVSGHPCALLDHPVLISPQGDGYWNPVPVFPSLENSYGDGPGWTGVFDPRYIAVLSIEYAPLDPNLGVCTTGRGPNVPFQPLALRLRDDDDRLPVPGGLNASACRPLMRLWSYDTTDA
jgi:hypothetical protein